MAAGPPQPTQPLHMQINFDVWRALRRELHAADVDGVVRISSSNAALVWGLCGAQEDSEKLGSEIINRLFKGKRVSTEGLENRKELWILWNVKVSICDIFDNA